MPATRNGAPSADIRLVCFDLGGVVIRICRSWDEGCIAAGLDVRTVCGVEERSRERLELIRRHQTGRIDCPAYARELSELMGGAYSPEEVLAVHHAWTRGVYEGVTEIIDELNRRGFETAALSNTSHSHWDRLIEVPAVRRMTHLAASHLLGLFKPDREIYRAFEAQVNRKPNEILFFDDLPENTAAAREAGWHAVHNDHTRCTATQIRAALALHIPDGG